MPYLRDENGNYVPAPSSKGADGREISLRVASTHIQWRYEDTEWENLVALSIITGPQGAGVEMRITSDMVLQYKLESDSEWITLFDLSALTRSMIFVGTAVSGTGTGISATVIGSKLGDLYINAEGNFYHATASNVWDYKGKIQGSLSTAITGILKGSSGTVVQAVAGTDYVIPSALTNYLLKSGGTMTGDLVAANPAVADSKVRNIVASTTDLTAGSSALTTGAVYFVYE